MCILVHASPPTLSTYTSYLLPPSLSPTPSHPLPSPLGRPRPRVWWTLKNESHEVILDESWEPLNKELTKNDLMLPHLNHELHQDRLVCHASNTNISLPLTASVTLLLNSESVWCSFRRCVMLDVVMLCCVLFGVVLCYVLFGVVLCYVMFGVVLCSVTFVMLCYVVWS